MSTNSMCLSHVPGQGHAAEYAERMQAATHALAHGEPGSELTHYSHARHAAHAAAASQAYGPLLDWLERHTVDA